MIKTLYNLASTFIKDTVEIAMPSLCVGCNKKHSTKHNYCDSCLVELLSLAACNYCPRCGATAGSFAKANIETGCVQCPTPMPKFARVYRIGPYQGAVKNSIRLLKYNSHFRAIDHLANLLCSTIQHDPNPQYYDAIIPIPMFWFSKITRGIDHTQTIAHLVARELNVPHLNSLYKQKNIPPQVKLSRAKRIENVSGAFGIKNSKAIADKNILLIDDVTTTGATASEAAKILLNAGCSRVDLAVIAKSEKTNPYSES